MACIKAWSRITFEPAADEYRVSCKKETISIDRCGTKRMDVTFLVLEAKHHHCPNKVVKRTRFMNCLMHMFSLDTKPRNTSPSHSLLSAHYWSSSMICSDEQSSSLRAWEHHHISSCNIYLLNSMQATHRQLGQKSSQFFKPEIDLPKLGVVVMRTIRRG